MIHANYQYIESEVAPSLSFISRLLGIGYAFLGLLGIAFILKLGELYMGLGCIAGAIALFFISNAYNKSVEKKIKDIMDNHPEKCIEIAYRKAIQNLTDSFSKKEISEADFSRMKDELKKEMVEEIRKYKPNYNYGDKL